MVCYYIEDCDFFENDYSTLNLFFACMYLIQRWIFLLYTVFELLVKIKINMNMSDSCFRFCIEQYLTIIIGYITFKNNSSICSIYYNSLYVHLDLPKHSCN